MKKNLSHYKAYSTCAILVISVFLYKISAQVSQYNFSQLIGAYTTSIPGYTMGNFNNDNQFFVNPAIQAGGSNMTGVGFAIGFNFIYAGHAFDRIGINTNGWISFGQSSLGSGAINMTSTLTNAYTPLSTNSSISPPQLRCRVAAFGENLQGQAGSSLEIITTGITPNQVCVIQWSNYKRFGNTGIGDMLNFQIRLYEGCNSVEIKYGPNTFGPASSTTTQVGLGGAGLVSSDFNNRTTTSNWNFTTAGIPNTATCSVNSSVITPGSGLSFYWSPPRIVGSSFRRRDISTIPSNERAQLSNLIVQFITSSSTNGLGMTGTLYHAINGQHGNCNFLPWHRSFLKKLEDYLLKQPGGECFVPLPKWIPTTIIPNEFFNSAPNDGTINQQNPSGGPLAYSFSSFANNPCVNSLCNFSTLLENEHGKVHVNISGAMGSIGTAAGSSIFYLWHAYIDDLYWNYQSNCAPWTFPDLDLYIRDTEENNGVEPNSNPQVWNSPDIWVRNNPDAFAVSGVPGSYMLGCTDDAIRHQNPEYSLNQAVYVYIKIRNRGTHPVNCAKLQLYWTKASPGEIWPDAWVNNGVNGNEITVGGGVTLPSLAPGQIYTEVITWYPPDPGAGSAMYCLLARINSPHDPMANEIGLTGASQPVFGNVLNNNNIATKNLYIVNNVPGIIGNSGTFSMNASELGLARIQFTPILNEVGISYTDIGTVTVALGEFYTNWEQAMFAASPFIEDIGEGNIRLLGGGDKDDYWINAMLYPDDTSSIALGFELSSDFSLLYGFQDWNFEFSHEVYDISDTGQPPGIILGAQNYNIVIDYPCEALAGFDTMILSGECIVIGTSNPCTSCNFEWFENGTLIPGVNGPALDVCPTFESTYILTVRDTSSGCHFSDTVIVYVDRICTAALGSNQFIIEHGECVQIGDSGATCPDCQFRWSPVTGLSNPNIPNPIACPHEDIVYTLTVIRDSFCFAESQVSVHVFHCDGMVDAGPDQNITLGEGVVIGTPDPTGSTSYSWYPQEGLSDPYAAQPFAQPTETTTYIVFAHHSGHDCFIPATDSVVVNVCTTYYLDNDGDSFGDITSAVFECSHPVGYVTNSVDCNDLNNIVNPIALEICNNGVDDNCDGQIDENGSILFNTGLTGYFPFNSNANDESPTEINGIGTNTILIDGLDGPNSAYNFDGSTSKIVAGTDNRGVTNAVSLVAWVKTTEMNNGQWVVGKYSFNEDKGYSLGIGDNVDGYIGRVAIGGRDGTSNYHSSGYSTTSINDGNWHCLIGTAGNDEWNIYVDGVFESRSPGSTIDLTTSDFEPLSIGWHTNPNLPLWMNGGIDEVRIYNRILNECEIDSVCFADFTSQTSQISPQFNLRIFPNPNNGEFTMELPEPAIKDMFFRIINLTGQLLLEKYAEVGSSIQRMQTINLSEGMYFVQILSEEGVIGVSRFVKQ